MQSILNYRLHPRPLAITLPVASFDPAAYSSAEPGIEGLVDLVRWELWRWNAANGDGESFTRTPLPSTAEDWEKSSLFRHDHPLKDELIPARRSMLDSLSMHSDELMDVLLDLSDPSAYAAVETGTILPALRNAVLNRDI